MHWYCEWEPEKSSVFLILQLFFMETGCASFILVAASYERGIESVAELLEGLAR